MRIHCGTFSFGVWVFELEFRVGVGERNWRFENLVRNTVVCLAQSTLSSQSNPKTQLRALGVRYIREFCTLGQRPKISLEIYSCRPHGRFQLGADALFCFRHSIYRIDRIEGIGIGLGNGTLHSPTRISNN